MSEVSYLTVLDDYLNIEVIKKSKFLSYFFPCESEEEFMEKLVNIKKEHHGANHFCYGFRFNGNVIQERYNDDGEPSGTAGLPILDVLRGQELLQCAIVVVRYFGGTKLGTGGLSRAYSDGARDIILLAKLVSKEEAAILDLQIDYSYVGKLDYYIEQEHIAIINKEFLSSVTYRLALKANKLEIAIQKINEMSNGTIQIIQQENQLGFFSDNKFIAG